MPVLYDRLTGVNLMLASAVIVIEPEHGPVAGSAAPPSLFTCEWPSTSQPPETINSTKPIVSRFIDDERRRPEFEMIVAPNRIAAVTIEPTTTGMCPCADRKRRERFSTMI